MNAGCYNAHVPALKQGPASEGLTLSFGVDTGTDSLCPIDCIVFASGPSQKPPEEVRSGTAGGPTTCRKHMQRRSGTEESPQPPSGDVL